MMGFQVCCFPNAPDYESLQAAKIGDYPLEQRDYKPYAQARICFSAEGLHVHLTSFEAESLPSSCILAVVRMKDTQPAITASLYADGRYSVTLSSGGELEGCLLLPFTGEDLQGVYWGGAFTIPYASLEQLPGGFQLIKGASFQGNFYKVCKDERKPHYGSFFPADFEKGLDAPQNLGTFLITDY